MIIGIADTMFARGDMGSLAEKTIRDNITAITTKDDNSSEADYRIVRYTVPGVKDLPVACKKLFTESSCDIVLACGYVGAEPVDKVCGHEASAGIQAVQLSEGKHIIEVFVHEDEGTDRKLTTIMHNRVVKHALNVLELLKGQTTLQQKAGTGERQGWNNASRLNIDNTDSDPNSPRSYKIGIIVSEFNREITFGMRNEATRYLESLGHTYKIIEVPGVFDMPLAIKKLCKSTEIDAIILLGAVIKGSTKHDETVANLTATLASQLAVQYNKPVTCGVIGPGANWEQAEARSLDYVKRSIDAALKMLDI